MLTLFYSTRLGYYLSNLFILFSFVESFIRNKARIINGKEINIQERPFQVQLRHGDCYEGCGFCGGAIIAPNWILTARHCVERYSSGVGVSVKAGTSDRRGRGEERNVAASSITVHDSAGSIDEGNSLLNLYKGLNK